MGEVPAWYPSLRAAQVLGLSFPELLAHPDRSTLVELALGADAAEVHAAAARRQRTF